MSLHIFQIPSDKCSLASPIRMWVSFCESNSQSKTELTERSVSSTNSLLQIHSLRGRDQHSRGSFLLTRSTDDNTPELPQLQMANSSCESPLQPSERHVKQLLTVPLKNQVKMWLGETVLLISCKGFALARERLFVFRHLAIGAVLVTFLIALTKIT